MCKHERTELTHRVIRLTNEEKPDEYRLELKLRCRDCCAQFLFKTKELGLLNDQPTTGIDRKELRIPLEILNPISSN